LTAKDVAVSAFTTPHVVPAAEITPPTIFNLFTISLPVTPPPEFAVLGRLKVIEVVGAPPLIVMSSCIFVVFPSVLNFAALTVNVAVLEDGEGV